MPFDIDGTLHLTYAEFACNGASGVKGAMRPEAVADGNDGNDPLVAVDTGYRQKLNSIAIRARGWETASKYHTVPLDTPTFVEINDAGDWMEGPEPVVSFEVYGDAKAYPL